MKNKTTTALAFVLAMVGTTTAQAQVLPTIHRDGSMTPKGGGAATPPPPPPEMPKEEPKTEGETPPDEATPPAEEAKPEDAAAPQGEKRYDFSGIHGVFGNSVLFQWATGPMFGGTLHGGFMTYPSKEIGIGLELRGAFKAGKEDPEIAGSVDLIFEGRLKSRLWGGVAIGPFLRTKMPDEGRLGVGPKVDKERLSNAGMRAAIVLDAFILPNLGIRLEPLAFEFDISQAELGGERAKNSETVRLQSTLGLFGHLW